MNIFKKGFYLLTDILQFVLLTIAMWIFATLVLVIALPIAWFWSVPVVAYKGVFKAGK